ncbi:PAP2-domain-containing protein [Auriculariales sp. MPI-PUGE-AT-0066]|nr:PAP2-domain-containing protein [Auriculariales sp. MPI-PUGE-AT-0066]
MPLSLPLSRSPSSSPTSRTCDLPSRVPYDSMYSHARSEREPFSNSVSTRMNLRSNRLIGWALSEKRTYTPWFLVKSYALDWVVSIALWGLFWYLGSIRGFRRRFSLTDSSLQYPYALHQRVPNIGLWMISTVSPLVLIPVISLITPARGIADIHSGWLGVVVSLTITGSITNLTKVLVGRPRPDLIDRCQPVPGSTNAAVYGLVTDDICTTTDTYIMDDGWRSFPSGHSSLCFAGLGFLTLFLAGKLHLWDRVGSGIKAWITLTPMCAAALVAISRTMDYRHHATDVIAGSILGTLVAYFSYRQYFPPLHSPTSHIPYPPLRKRSDALLPQSVEEAQTQVRNSERVYRDEEEGGIGLTRELGGDPRRRDSSELVHPEVTATSSADNIASRPEARSW